MLIGVPSAVGHVVTTGIRCAALANEAFTTWLVHYG